ncbi:MAG: hypothetical protein C0603_05145 [Denitrovibrio sp.]|nr:MAG: hypothetical protein C0603_05145 [Denitrovibrio sp.]
MVKLRDYTHYFNVVLFGIIALFGRAYEHGMTSDNIHYAAISKGLLTSENPLLLSLAGEPYLNKPPLFFWLNSIAIWVFGSNVYGAKFISVLATILLMLIVFHLAYKAFESVDVGYGAVLFFLVNYVVFKNSQACRLESLLTLFTMLSLIFSYKYTVNRKRKFLIIAGAFAGLAVLTKGFAGVFIFAFIVLYLLASEPRKKALLFDLLLSGLAFVACFAWWYAYAFANTDLYQVMVINESINRVSAVNDGSFNDLSLFKHTETMLKYNLLLLIFFVLGCKRKIWGMKSLKYIKFFAWFLLAYYISIHFISSKYSRYLYVMMPLMSIVASVGLVSVLKIELRKVVIGIMVIYSVFMILYPLSTGQGTFDELKIVKSFAKENSLSVCVDAKYYEHWEPKSAMLFYYGDGYSVGNCQDSDIKITSKKASCEGNIIIKNKKIQACLR